MEEVYFKNLIKEKLVPLKHVQALRQVNFYKTWAILIIINCIATMALLRSNFSYIDDMGRIAFGYKGWDYFNRFTSQFLSGFLHGNLNYLGDISPLPQLIAIITISFASSLVIFLIGKDYKIRLGDILSVLPISLSPYFLECLSYKFDSPYMALSILTSIFPFFFKNDRLLFFFVSILGLLVTLTTYQASLGIYPLMTIAVAYTMYNKQEKIRKIFNFIIFSCSNFITSLLIFKILILRPFDSYVSSKISFLSFATNIKHYIELLKNDLPFWILVVIALSIVFFILSSVFSKRNKLLNLLLSISFVIFSILFCTGIYPFLEKPLFATRAMYGFGMALSLILLLTNFNTTSLICKIPIIIISWFLITFSLIYGNALCQQKNYTNFRTNIILSELNTLLPKFENIDSITLVGTVGHAPAITQLIKNYPVFRRLIPIQLQANWMWGYYELENYLKLSKYKFKNFNNNYQILNSSTLIQNGYFQEFRMLQNTLFIVVK